MKRMLARVAAAAVLAGPVAVAATGAAPATAADVPRCNNGDLTASYRPTGAAAGTQYGKLRFTNTSSHACVIGGYGGLSYVGHGSGTQIGAAADRTPSKVRSLVLQPGQRAVSVVSEANALNFPKRKCHPVHVDGFRVYAPNAVHSQFVPHDITGCAKSKVHLLAHKAYRRAGG